jgi:hypothetical protein
MHGGHSCLSNGAGPVGGGAEAQGSGTLHLQNCTLLSCVVGGMLDIVV